MNINQMATRSQWRAIFGEVQVRSGAVPTESKQGSKLFVLADIEPYLPNSPTSKHIEMANRVGTDIEKAVTGTSLREIKLMRRLDESRCLLQSIRYLEGVIATDPQGFEVLRPFLTGEEVEGISGVQEEIAARRAIKSSDLPEYEKVALRKAIPNRRDIGPNTLLDIHLDIGRREAAIEKRRIAKEVAYQAARSRAEKERINSNEWYDEQIALGREEAEARRRRRFIPEGCPYRTLKAAYKDGWVEERAEHYNGETLHLKGHELTRNAKKAMSRTQWKAAGYQVICDATPHAEISNGWTIYPVYREDQVVRSVVRPGATEPMK